MRYLDSEGLSNYDELIKDYIDNLSLSAKVEEGVLKFAFAEDYGFDGKEYDVDVILGDVGISGSNELNALASANYARIAPTAIHVGNGGDVYIILNNLNYSMKINGWNASAGATEDINAPEGINNLFTNLTNAYDSGWIVEGFSMPTVNFDYFSICFRKNDGGALNVQDVQNIKNALTVRYDEV